METEQSKPEGHPDKKIWLTTSIFVTIVFLTCGWLAFYDAGGVTDPSEQRDKKFQAAAATLNGNETVRLVAQEPNGFRVSYQHQGQAGGFYVVVRFGHEAPIRGQNHLSVVVLDSLRNKVSGATVKVEYLMPSLPGRPPMMQNESTAQQEKDLYYAGVSLSMKGEWIFRVKVSKDDQKGTFEFPVKVLQ